MTGDQLSIDDALEGLGRVIPSRETDPETSHAAAESVKVKAGSQRARLLKAFVTNWYAHGDGLTDEQAMMCAEGVNQLSCWWKRCSELRDGGFIAPTGETRTATTGVQRLVARVTDKGIDWVRANR